MRFFPFREQTPRTLPQMNRAEFKHLLGKARDATVGGREAWAVMSTGEKVAVALVLNRPDWLNEMRYTLAEAIERTGPEWLALIPLVEQVLREEG